MADRPLLFDDLVRTPNLRAKAYVVLEPPGAAFACVELSARRLEDWFFARRWVSIRSGRRVLYWLLDEIEAHGYRFHLASGPRGRPGEAPVGEERWGRASKNRSELSEEEQRIHRDLFPHEHELLERGYDWDENDAYRAGVALPMDSLGRRIEEEDGIVYEWVRIAEEWTWRRYPLYRVTAYGTTEPAPGSCEPAV